MKKKIFIIIIILFLCFIPLTNISVAKADDLSNTIIEELENIDLSQLEEYYDNLEIANEKSFFEMIFSFVNGEYAFDFSSFSNYIINVLLGQVLEFLPAILTVVAITILTSIIKSFRESCSDDGVFDIVFFVCYCAILLVLSSHVLTLVVKTKNIIENIAKITEIMSPIILTLMTASGASASAGLYKPVVVFLSSGISNVFLSIVLPIVSAIIIFSVLSNFSVSIKLKKYCEFFSSIIKWVIGIIITIFTIFLSVQGIASATHDGISIKIAKYAISNSIPIVGGFVRDGFDLILAGSLIIKNTVGIVIVIMLFYTVIGPIITLAAFSLMLKLCSAVVEPIADTRITDFCSSLSKSVVYLIVSIICVGLMLFITVLLMMFSASSII